MAASIRAVMLAGVLNKPMCAAAGAFVNHQQLRYAGRQKHYDPRFKKQRRAKLDTFLRDDFFKKQEKSKQGKFTAQDERDFRLSMARPPPRTYQENTMDLTSSEQVFDAYIPPEGDGKASKLSKDWFLDQKEAVKGKTASLRDTRKLKQYEGPMDMAEFAQEAQNMYIEAQTLLENCRDNKDRLHDLVTTYAYPAMTFGLENKTLRWNFVESVEPPRVVHVRVSPMVTKENLYGQVTVRLHTRQLMALYDRFGRLMYGSETLAKDCLEYVVFEKHIVDEYGRWRVHTKLLPDWMPPRDPLRKTYRKAKSEAAPEEEETETEEKRREVRSIAG